MQREIANDATIPQELRAAQFLDVLQRRDKRIEIVAVNRTDPSAIVTDPGYAGRLWKHEVAEIFWLVCITKYLDSVTYFEALIAATFGASPDERTNHASSVDMPSRRGQPSNRELLLAEPQPISRQKTVGDVWPQTTET